MKPNDLIINGIFHVLGNDIFIYVKSELPLLTSWSQLRIIILNSLQGYITYLHFWHQKTIVVKMNTCTISDCQTRRRNTPWHLNTRRSDTYFCNTLVLAMLTMMSAAWQLGHLNCSHYTGIWAVSERCVSGVWAVSELCLSGVWAVCERCLSGVWEVSERCMSEVLAMSERCLSCV